MTQTLSHEAIPQFVAKRKSRKTDARSYRVGRADNRETARAIKRAAKSVLEAYDVGARKLQDAFLFGDDAAPALRDLETLPQAMYYAVYGDSHPVTALDSDVARFCVAIGLIGTVLDDTAVEKLRSIKMTDTKTLTKDFKDAQTGSMFGWAY